MSGQTRALGDVRIVDLTDERAIYGVKLLADLGADVIRPEPLEGDALRSRGPMRADTTDKNESSLWHAFFASNRRFFSTDPDTPKGAAQLQTLVTKADLVLLSSDAFGTKCIDIEQARHDNPALVSVECTSFGKTGPWKDYLAPDLVAGALGGSVASTGDADTPPLKTFGELNFMVSGCYVAIAALAALRHSRETGEGQNVHVPVHQCIASCLEHVFFWHWYNHMFPTAEGKALERRGSLHWTNLYVVMQAIGGSIMVMPTPDVDRQLAWLIEEGAAADLIDSKYQEPEHRDEFLSRMMDVLRDWVATKDVEELFFEAQERHAPYGWVLPIEKLAINPQLQARDWWTTYRMGDRDIQGPGAPYRFGGTPWTMAAYESIGSNSAVVLQELGWDANGNEEDSA